MFDVAIYHRLFRFIWQLVIRYCFYWYMKNDFYMKFIKFNFNLFYSLTIEGKTCFFVKVVIYQGFSEKKLFHDKNFLL